MVVRIECIARSCLLFEQEMAGVNAQKRSIEALLVAPSAFSKG
jgi:hypothetical protein